MNVSFALHLVQVAAHMQSRGPRQNSSSLALLHGMEKSLSPADPLRGALASVPSTIMLAGVDLGIQHNEVLQELSMPVLALSVGLCLHAMKEHQLLGRLLVFFGAQTFMNLYMKIVMSRCVVSAAQGLVGIPAPFLITALQQVVSFALMMSLVAVSVYTPRRVETRAEVTSILCLSVCFTLNIALNNFSMALLDLSVNLMIRSFAPLTTYLCQVALAQVMGTPMTAKTVKSMVLIFVGVMCGALVVFAKSTSFYQADASAEMYLGVVSCLLSLLAAASELNVIRIMGTGTRLNGLDAVCYMAVPSALMLLPCIFLSPHPVSWPGHAHMTDFAVIQKVYALNPKSVVLALLSGVFALSYNAMLYNIVQALSAAHAATASNFNKMAVIALSYLFGMEALPPAPWNMLVVFGVLGNGAAFASFGYAEAHAAAEAAKSKESQESNEGKKPENAPPVINNRDVKSYSNSSHYDAEIHNLVG